MDYQRDYILRLIHMMGDLMRRVLKKLDDRERGRMLNDACREFCGMSLETGEALAEESLVAMLAPLPRLMMSELLYIKAATCELPVGDDDALRLRSLRLLASLHTESQLCDLRAARLTELKAGLMDELNAGDLMDCARFLSQAERYDGMEDALFQALDREEGEPRERDRQEAARMLRRAARAPERSLALCGMTAQELRASARELETEINPNEQENPQ